MKFPNFTLTPVIICFVLGVLCSFQFEISITIPNTLLLLTNAIGLLIAWILYNRKWMWVAGLLMTLSFITGMNRAKQALQHKKSHYINYYDLKKIMYLLLRLRIILGQQGVIIDIMQV